MARKSKGKVPYEVRFRTVTDETKSFYAFAKCPDQAARKLRTKGAKIVSVFKVKD